MYEQLLCKLKQNVQVQDPQNEKKCEMCTK